MNLTDRDKQIIKEHIDRGEPLPHKYKVMLFADAPEVELIWQGKTSEITSVILPFQSIEQIDEPRAETMSGKTLDLFAADSVSGRQSGGWTNKLIWGDNKLVLSSLKNGPMRREIEAAGGLKLIYIDPPFDVGADFSFDIEIGEGEKLTKEPSVIEELAYRDTWGRGTDSYLAMMYERLRLMRDLLAENGSIYVHCDWRVNSTLRLVLAEIFGRERFVNELIWQKTRVSKSQSVSFGNIHDTILFYSKSDDIQFEPQFVPHSESYQKSHYNLLEAEAGRLYGLWDFTQGGQGEPRRFGDKILPPPAGKHWIWSQQRIDEGLTKGIIVFTSSGMPRLKRYLDESKGNQVGDIWLDIYDVNAVANERLNYATQKPEVLLERMIRASSKKGDLVADFFCGSGTTLAVAENLGRKWIGCDLGRFAIHTTRKRLIGVQRKLKAKGYPYRSFEILNLGKYERQYFVGINPNLPEEERTKQAIQKEEQYLSLILTAYKAERLTQMPPFHGKKSTTAVVVGPIDAPVTLALVNEIIDECCRKQISKVDILGFEFEMGLKPVVQDEARQKGVSLSLKYIPKDVFDKRAVERGQVQFYDVAYVEVLPKVKESGVVISLTDFGVFYRQDDLDALGEKLKPGGSKVTVDEGQVVKIVKDKKGKITREVLTKKWTDWIDYWAVDFDYANRPEVIRIVEDGEEREVWTGNYIFENEWQSYRTRKDRNLELTSGEHTYDKPGRYKIAVKVIDIFGNDTTKVVEVKV
ncbi:MAG: DNA methyltransferase [Desulfomonilaceae bacterium]